MTARHQFVLFAAVLGLGCSDLTSPALLDGTWTHDFSIPGNGLEFTLTTNGSAVSGTGTWAGEACCGGPVTVTGDATGGEVNLDFTLTANGNVVPPHSYHFIGRLVDRNTLSGDIASGDQILNYSYRRIR